MTRRRRRVLIAVAVMAALSGGLWFGLSWEGGTMRRAKQLQLGQTWDQVLHVMAADYSHVYGVEGRNVMVFLPATQWRVYGLMQKLVGWSPLKSWRFFEYPVVVTFTEDLRVERIQRGREVVETR
jgi:hypothetical protein